MACDGLPFKLPEDYVHPIYVDSSLLEIIRGVQADLLGQVPKTSDHVSDSIVKYLYRLPTAHAVTNKITNNKDPIEIENCGKVATCIIASWAFRVQRITLNWDRDSNGHSRSHTSALQELPVVSAFGLEDSSTSSATMHISTRISPDRSSQQGTRIFEPNG
jgi:hypothetical protein